MVVPEPNRRLVRGTGKVLRWTGKGTWVGLKLTGKVTSKAMSIGSRASAAGARRALGGTGYVRSAEDINGRIADALRVLDGALRARDAYIAQLEERTSQLESRRR